MTYIAARIACREFLGGRLESTPGAMAAARCAGARSRRLTRRRRVRPIRPVFTAPTTVQTLAIFGHDVVVASAAYISRPLRVVSRSAVRRAQTGRDRPPTVSDWRRPTGPVAESAAGEMVCWLAGGRTITRCVRAGRTYARSVARRLRLLLLLRSVS